MKKKRLILLTLLFLCSIVFTACGSSQSNEIITENQQPSDAKAAEAEPESDDKTPIVEEAAAALSPDPQVVTFSTSDGVELNGVFYPSGATSSPLIILMHWALGDQRDWEEIAYWLQNRGLGEERTDIESKPWLDSSWFPASETDMSYNIFTFTFRNCENGCKSFEREKWYSDVQAAIEYAYELEGINKDSIIMIGASIGADGAADGCVYLNQLHPDACNGAFSFSSANYLTINYVDMVNELGVESDPKPAWCLYGESDLESAPVCGNITGDNYTLYAYPPNMVFSNGHGMNLIAPDQDPDPLGLILKFLEMVT